MKSKKTGNKETRRKGNKEKEAEAETPEIHRNRRFMLVKRGNRGEQREKQNPRPCPLSLSPSLPNATCPSPPDSACNANYESPSCMPRAPAIEMQFETNKTDYAKPKYSPPAVMAVYSALRRSSYDSYSGRSSSAPRLDGVQKCFLHGVNLRLKQV
jgi:hypothetical protein